ncbi:MAG: extracellular solute-binding protein [Oscillospiraceae bacterium]|jgi:raffinose/stachyose/melibiose transport system substrate-binding protein|nr:extracellular solute-binding protein [Oscillospiraceae bacterium]
MEKSCREILTGVLALCVLTGCLASDLPVLPPSAAAETVGLTGELEILHYLDGAKLELWEQFVEEFTDMHPGVVIKTTGIDYENFLPLMHSRAAAGDLPDFWQAAPVEVADLVKAGMVLDLKRAGVIDRLPLKGNNIFAECSWGDDGAIWGAPYSMTVCALFYNKDIFDSYGLKAPVIQSEFLEICKILKRNGVDPFIRANSDYQSLYADLCCELIPRLIAKGHADYYTRLMNGQSTFADYEEFRLATDNMLVRYNWSRPDDMENDMRTAAEKFAAGEAAMYIGQLTAMTQVMDINPDFNLHCVPFPFTEYQRINHKMVIELDDGWMINANAEAPEVAIEWLKFLYETEQAQRWSDRVGLLMVQTGLDISGQKPYLRELAYVHRSGKTVQNCVPTLIGEFAGQWPACLQSWIANPQRSTDMLIENGQNVFDVIIASQK